MERYFKILIIAIVIIIVFIILSILLINRYSKNSYETVSNVNNNTVDEFDVEYNNENIINHNTFFNVEKCIKYYLDYINDDNFDAVYKVLDTKYINRNNITKQNIENKTLLKGKGTILIVNNMRMILENENMNVVEVEGKVLNSQNNTFERFNIIVAMDISNNIFSIVPDAKDDVNLSIEADDEDFYNEIDYKLYTQEDIVNKYMEYYKIIAQHFPEDLFLILDEKYKEKRFNNSVEYFKEYLNQIDIENIYEDKYSVNVYMDYTQYICMDKNNNYYIFDETNPMKVSIKLDTYTIEDEEYITNYNNSSDEVKVNTNVNKIIKMINTKNYKQAFNLLNDNFKNNNYSSEKEFKEDIIEKLYEYNNVTLNNIENINGNYICNLDITSTNEFEKNVIPMRMVIKLKEKTDFEYSFSIGNSEN